MSSDLTDFPSKRFYGGKLKSSDEAAKGKLVLSKPSRQYTEHLDPDHPSVFVEVESDEYKAPNYIEANLAAELIAEAIRRGIPPREIAIVSPYTAQVSAIRAAINKSAVVRDALRVPLANWTVDDLFIDTIHRIQGQERDLVIVSYAVGGEFAGKNADFLFDPKLFNVAITRARVKRIILANPDIMDAQSYRYREWIAHLIEFHKTCHVVQFPDPKEIPW